MNLLKETVEILNEHNKKQEDVLWCGSKTFGSFSWSNFEAVADVNYDNGYGSPAVAEDLVVVGSDFWLERHEYDGSEWWEFKQIPTKPAPREVECLTIGQANKRNYDVSCGWESLINVNGKGVK